MNTTIKNISILDTTLRDGQQCPGGWFRHNNYIIKYAEMISNIMRGGDHIIEAGFPASSKNEFNIVHEIAGQFGTSQDSPIIAGLSQLRLDQIEKTIESLRPCIHTGKARLHTYIPIDPILLKASLKVGHHEHKKKFQKIKELNEWCKIASQEGMQVEFSLEGYSRIVNGKRDQLTNRITGEIMDNFDFGTDLICAAIEGGARIINCPDTIGGANEAQGEGYFANIMNKHAQIISSKYPDIDITWSVHCHDDYGMAVANSINGVIKGPASQIECTINGVGERAGNAHMQSIVMNIISFYTDKGIIIPNFDISKFQEISDFVDKNILPRQPNSPINGANSARHSSGGHTNAILDNPLVYQPFDPKIVGNEIGLDFGPSSGGKLARAIIEKNGGRCGKNEQAKIVQFIKDFYIDRRKGITENELMIAYNEYRKMN